MRKIHFIGIGGIGMSALARYYLSIGYSVSGSDNSRSEITDLLVQEGIDVKIGTNADNVNDEVSKVIYTIAIPANNLELLRAKELQEKVGEHNLQILSYPQALGEMTRGENVIAVCGTHGKTTTTAMTYFALKNAGVNVSMIVGSLIDIDGKKTNYVPINRLHQGSDSQSWIVIEACEYRRSFLNYNPQIILVTNIDNDHLDYFRDSDDIKNAFQEFVDKLPRPCRGETEYSALVIHKDEDFLNTNSTKLVCENISNVNDIQLSVPGKHNRKNAQLVVALAEHLKLDIDKILAGLKNFKGTWRRQEYKGEHFGAIFYDDYAHHPTEIRATLQAFREKFADKKIIAIFQPHLYSRTKMLFDDFVDAFSDADEVVVLPIYAAREKLDESISSQMVVDKINLSGKPATLINNENLLNYLQTKDIAGKVVITLGAGNIYDIYKQINI